MEVRARERRVRRRPIEDERSVNAHVKRRIIVIHHQVARNPSIYLVTPANVCHAKAIDDTTQHSNREGKCVTNYRQA